MGDRYITRSKKRGDEDFISEIDQKPSKKPKTSITRIKHKNSATKSNNTDTTKVNSADSATESNLSNATKRKLGDNTSEIDNPQAKKVKNKGKGLDIRIPEDRAQSSPVEEVGLETTYNAIKEKTMGFVSEEFQFPMGDPKAVLIAARQILKDQTFISQTPEFKKLETEVEELKKRVSEYQDTARFADHVKSSLEMRPPKETPSTLEQLDTFFQTGFENQASITKEVEKQKQMVDLRRDDAIKGLQKLIQEQTIVVDFANKLAGYLKTYLKDKSFDSLYNANKLFKSDHIEPLRENIIPDDKLLAVATRLQERSKLIESVLKPPIGEAHERLNKAQKHIAQHSNNDELVEIYKSTKITEERGIKKLQEALKEASDIANQAKQSKKSITDIYIFRKSILNKVLDVKHSIECIENEKKIEESTNNHGESSNTQPEASTVTDNKASHPVGLHLLLDNIKEYIEHAETAQKNLISNKKTVEEYIKSIDNFSSKEKNYLLRINNIEHEYNIIEQKYKEADEEHKEAYKSYLDTLSQTFQDYGVIAAEVATENLKKIEEYIAGSLHKSAEYVGQIQSLAKSTSTEDLRGHLLLDRITGRATLADGSATAIPFHLSDIRSIEHVRAGETLWGRMFESDHYVLSFKETLKKEGSDIARVSSETIHAVTTIATVGWSVSQHPIAVGAAALISATVGTIIAQPVSSVMRHMTSEATDRFKLDPNSFTSGPEWQHRNGIDLDGKKLFLENDLTFNLDDIDWLKTKGDKESSTTIAFKDGGEANLDALASVFTSREASIRKQAVIDARQKFQKGLQEDLKHRFRRIEKAAGEKLRGEIDAIEDLINFAKQCDAQEKSYIQCLNGLHPPKGKNEVETFINDYKEKMEFLEKNIHDVYESAKKFDEALVGLYD